MLVEEDQGDVEIEKEKDPTWVRECKEKEKREQWEKINKMGDNGS